MTVQEAMLLKDSEYLNGLLDTLQSAYEDMVGFLGKETADIGWWRNINKTIDTYLDLKTKGFLKDYEFTSIISTISKFIKKNDPTKNWTNDVDSILESSSEESNTKEYLVGDLLLPKNYNDLPVFSASNSKFVTPNTIDLRDYCLETRNQGNKPWCAAYSAAGMASNILWRKNDVPKEIEVSSLYAYAKKIDGSPSMNGTTLTAVLEALLNQNYFDDKICSVKVLRGTEYVRYAIHKFGCCLLGLMVTDEWYKCNRNKSTITGSNDGIHSNLGGHAVLGCGYNRDGVIIQNSWGKDWGEYGFALITWDEFNREFSYGAVLDNCLYDTKIN